MQVLSYPPFICVYDLWRLALNIRDFAPDEEYRELMEVLEQGQLRRAAVGAAMRHVAPYSMRERNRAPEGWTNGWLPGWWRGP